MECAAELEMINFAQEKDLFLMQGVWTRLLLLLKSARPTRTKSRSVAISYGVWLESVRLKKPICSILN
jgi:hypothetical protein